MELIKSYIAHKPPKEGSEYGSVNYIDIEPNNFYFATASDDKTIKIWALENFYNYDTGQLITTLPEQESIVNFVKFFDNGRLLLSVNWIGQIKLYKRSNDWLNYDEIICIRPIKTNHHSRLYEKEVFENVNKNILIFNQKESTNQIIIEIDIKNNTINMLDDINIESCSKIFKKNIILDEENVSNSPTDLISAQISMNNCYYIRGYHNGKLEIFCNKKLLRTNMSFIVIDNPIIVEKDIIKKIKPNTCILSFTNWNDYNYYTSFNLYYYDLDSQLHNIGRVKIGNINMTENKGNKKSSIINYIPKIFYNLNPEFFSLGEDENYYIEVKNLKIKNIVTSLNDIVNMSASEAKKYKKLAVYKHSILRHTTEDNIRTIYSQALLGEIKPLDYEFTYTTNDNNTKLEINVNPSSLIPTNIHAIIGRNGSGKTRLLSGIANSLTKTKDKFSLKGKINFKNKDYRFVNLIVVAFSVFDNFIPIKSKDIKSNIKYEYIGLKEFNVQQNDNKNNDEQKISQNICFRDIKDLEEDFINTLSDCLKNNATKELWLDSIKTLENADGNFAGIGLSNYCIKYSNGNTLRKHFKILSSGHKIILYTITKLVLLTRDKTLILIDEPENHLHPPLLSAYIRVLSNLLKKKNAVSVIATHSPIILQEIPKSCVNLIRKIDESHVCIGHLDNETFGENVGTLTREVFGYDIQKSGFYTLLESELQDTTYTEFLKKANKQLGSEANLYARMIDKNRENNNV